MHSKSYKDHHDTTMYHDEAPESARYRVSRRGELNSQRKGLSKIHRRYQPLYMNQTPKGIAGKVFACITHHDWNRNPSLMALRKRGYTPYSRQFDSNFVPRPMRLGVRSESREALTALSFALAANCDYSPDSEYPFEVVVPFEFIAKQMGVLHRYEDGRVAYDVAYHALRVTEEIDHIYVVRGMDKDSGQYKPLRIFLKTEFFTSKGISLEELKSLLYRFQAWARKKGLSQTLKERNERHLLRLARLGLSIDKLYSLKKLLKRVKWQITSPELIAEKKKVMGDISEAIHSKGTPQTEITSKSQWFKWVNSGQAPTFLTQKIELEVRKSNPHLLSTDEEQFYRLLLERAGIGAG
ncbi:hypothetical protein EXT65_21255 [Pectobacterium carotovorum subsp. carotovorum]|nr:hypothetical protein [Pectobacterium carotovorum]MCL6336323.1 hypothetical protein [Pectobacterium carotovorum subsp. carotovorum]